MKRTPPSRAAAKLIVVTARALFGKIFDTAGLDRLYVRGLGNIHKELLIQPAACNLALLMRALYGAGKPRAAHDR